MKTITTIEQLAKNIQNITKSFSQLHGTKYESVKDVESILNFYKRRCLHLNKDCFYVNILTDGFVTVNDEKMYGGLNCKVYVYEDRIDAIYMIENYETN